MEHEISSIQVLHYKKQVALHRGIEGEIEENEGMEGEEGKEKVGREKELRN